MAPAPAVAVLPAIKKVVTMLNNLVTMMDSEAVEDEKKVAHFVQFCEGEISSCNAKISEMQTKIEDTNAALVDLGSQKQELDATVAKLNGNIDQETSQINDATEKRKTENEGFNKEQIDFENAIAACDKAVKLLAAHYGEPAGPAEKPDFLSLLGTIKSSVDQLKKGRHATLALHVSKSLKLLQQRQHVPNNNVYQDSAGEAGSIVEQIKLLSSTFSEDKASAIDEEGRLQKTFDNLIGKKTELLNSLTTERDTNQADLNAVNQNIAEQSSALKMAEDVLTDQQRLLATVTKQQKEAEDMFAARKADREAELEAVKKGLSILEKVSFVQSENTEDGKALLTLRKRQPFAECQQCAKVAAMLRQKATVYHSSVLSAAAATSMGSDAIDDVIKNLNDLITRIAQEQKTEGEHKAWCEQETGLTTAKREDHSSIVTELTGVMADLKEVINEKGIALDVNQETITDEDTNFEEQQELRNEGKAEFEEDLQDHLDAIQALNEAIEILANFYAKRNAKLIQTSAVAQPIKQANFLQKADQPSGGKAVEVMSGIRGEFEVAKVNLEKDETEAVETFDDLKKMHMKTDSDLESDKNTITVEEQTAESQLDQATTDKTSNEGEVAAADSYLQQLGKSCYPLMMHFDERTKLRKEEKAAIKDAIKVLRNA